MLAGRGGPILKGSTDAARCKEDSRTPGPGSYRTLSTFPNSAKDEDAQNRAVGGMEFRIQSVGLPKGEGVIKGVVGVGAFARNRKLRNSSLFRISGLETMSYPSHSRFPLSGTIQGIFLHIQEYGVMT